MAQRTRRPLYVDPARVVRDYFAHKAGAADLCDAYLETALYLEDTLGITLTDDDLTAERLGDEEAILRLVEQKTRGEA